MDFRIGRSLNDRCCKNKKKSRLEWESYERLRNKENWIERTDSYLRSYQKYLMARKFKYIIGWKKCLLRNLRSTTQHTIHLCLTLGQACLQPCRRLGAIRYSFKRIQTVDWKQIIISKHLTRGEGRKYQERHSGLILFQLLSLCTMSIEKENWLK